MKIPTPIVETQELVDFLRDHLDKDVGFINRLKSIYRPYICPFDDLLNLIPEHQHILDIGCGVGTLLQLVAQYRKPLSLAGLETTPSMIEGVCSWFNRYSPNILIRLEAYDGTNLPTWISDYEYVFLIDVLHHVPRARQTTFLEKLFHLLKPGAKLIIKDIDADEQFWCLFNKLHDMVVSREISHEVAATQLHSTLRQIGFETDDIVKKRLHVYPHYTIACQKPCGIQD